MKFGKCKLENWKIGKLENWKMLIGKWYLKIENLNEKF